MSKVNVATDIDVAFRFKFSWWSKWIDIAVFDHSCKPYLVQMKVSRTNKKKFRSVSTVGLMGRYSNSGIIGDLNQMGAVK